jgi:hypothetical protein
MMRGPRPKRRHNKRASSICAICLYLESEYVQANALRLFLTLEQQLLNIIKQIEQIVRKRNRAIVIAPMENN